MTDSAEVEIDWKYMAWTQSLAAGRAWDAGYAAAKEQYGGFSINLANMADEMRKTVRAELDELMYRRLASAALHHIEKQADA